MKITKSWRSRGQFSVKFLGGILSFGLLAGFLVPQVWAVEPGSGAVRDVTPGAGTLKAAVKAANEGDTLRLKPGSYTGNWNEGREVEIDKTLTIEGAGVGQTTIDVPIKITAADKEVILKNFGSSTTDVERNFVYVSVDQKTKLTMENISIWGILRGENGIYPIHDATGISIKPEAEGSEITLNDVMLMKPGVHYGILNKSSNTRITLDNNSELEGRATIQFEDGSNNTLDIKGGSEIAGPSSLYTDNRSIVINRQNGLRINLDDGKIAATMPKGSDVTKVLAIDADSTDTKIDLKNNSTISYQVRDGRTNVASTIFDFNPAVTAENRTEITMDNTSRLYRSVQDNHYNEVRQENVEVVHEYSTLNNGAVVGVFDKDGGRTIKVSDNETEIADLANKNYDDEAKEGYNFKGWFKTFDGANYSDEYVKLSDGSYEKAKTGANMDLYPKFLKRVKVKIGNEEFVLEENQTLNDLHGVNIDEKLENLRKEDLNFKGYVLHGETGGDISFTTDDVAALKEKPITEDVTIEAIHDVTIEVNGKPFKLEVGQTVADIDDQGAYNSAKWNGEEEKYFSRLVYEGEDRTFEETTPINNNIEVVTKHYRSVMVEGDDTEYLVEEGKTITEDKDDVLRGVLMTIQEAPVENKTFGRFVDSENNDTTVDLENYTISKKAVVRPVYTVNMKIGENDYRLDEGQSLRQHEDHEQIKADLKELAQEVETAGRELKGFILSSGGVERTIDADKSNSDEKIEEVLNEEISGNTEIYAKYMAKVIIKCPESACGAEQKEFEVETGTRLVDLLGTEEGVDYEKAKYQQYENDERRDERFGDFVVEGTDELFTEDQEIAKSLTLLPKYYAFVTIVDERPNVGGEYKVEFGKTLDEIVPLNGQTADTIKVLTTLRSDIVPEVGEDGQVDPDAEDLHFDGVVKSGTKEFLSGEIAEDVKIEGLYHYDVIVVEDYNNPNKDFGGVDNGLYGFKVYRGEGLGDVAPENLSKVEAALRGLMNTATNAELGRKFYRFYDEKLGVTYDGEALKEKIFNRHLYITAKVEYKVVIADDSSEYYVVEGEKIGSSEAIKGTMEALEEVENKNFAGYTLNNTAIQKDDLLNTVVTDGSNKIDAKYNVTVTIGEDKFEVVEGANLNSLKDSEKQKAEKALEKLRKDIEDSKQEFKGYSIADSLEDVMKYNFAQNTTVVAKAAIKVTIDKNDEYELQAGQRLSDVVDLSKYKDERGDGRVFSRFVDEDENTFDEDAPLAKNEKLTTKYAFVVTIEGDNSYRSEEGSALNSDPKIAGKLADLKTAKPEKTFGRFEDSDTGQEIAEDEILTRNTTITPVYRVTIKIEETPYLIDEGGSLRDLVGDAGLTSQLERLENLGNKRFAKYVVDGHEFSSREELMDWQFEDNATVVVKYNVEVSINGESVLLPEGTKYADATELKNLVNNLAVPAEKDSLAFVVNEGGEQVGDDYVFSVNTELTPKYYVVLKFDGVDGEAKLIEGQLVGEAEELVAKLTSNEKKDFKNKFATGETLESPVTKNVTLAPLYTVTVTVQNHDGSSHGYVVDEGTTLQDLVDGDYVEPERFKRFEDLDGNELPLNDALYEHKTVVPVYEITITLPDGSEETLESGQSLKDLDEETLSSLKTDTENRKFSRLVKKGTKETIEEDEPLYENLAVEPKFLNNITMTARDDEGSPVGNNGDLNLELEEGLPLSELSEDQKDNLNRWLRDNMIALAEAGKPDYALSYYADEDGNKIDGAGLKNNDKVIAVFTYQPQAVVPEVSDDTTEGEAKSPDTGYNEGEESASYAIEIVSVAVVLAGVSLAAVLKFKRSK